MVGINLGEIQVSTSNNGPLDIDHWANRIADKIIHIGSNAPKPVLEQALAFKEEIRSVSKMFISAAIASDRSHLAKELEDAGQKEMAEFVRNKQWR